MMSNKKRNICFISPRSELTNDKEVKEIYKEVQKSSLYFQSLSFAFSSGLLVLAALTPEDFASEYIDENYEEILYSKEFDIVAISAMTHQAVQAYKIADEYKARGSYVVLGGIHPSVLPHEAKKHADSVFIGEAENIWLEFLNDFKNDRAKPFYRSNKIVDMKKTPRPLYELIKQKNEYKNIWIQTSRGCPHDCYFCGASRIYGFKYRQKSIEQIVDEIGIVKKLWPGAMINFADDNLLVNKRTSSEFVENIRKLDITWAAQSDISIARHNDLLDDIYKAGCETLLIGFESIIEENLKEVNSNGWKYKQFEKYEYSIEKIQSKGIAIVGTFILGLDNDDKSYFDKLIEFIIKNKIFASHITILTPLPGTRLYEKMEKEKRLLNNSWSSYTFSEVNFIPRNMTGEELKEGFLKVNKAIYQPEIRQNLQKHFFNIYKKL